MDKARLNKDRCPRKTIQGYTIIILLFAVFVLTLGLTIAIPVWQTQIQREKEEELIFRGNQYIEAIRIFQLKNPGRFPESLDELFEEKCIRRLYKDPMTKHGEWKLILLPEGFDTRRSRRTPPSRRRRPQSRRGRKTQSPISQPRKLSIQKVMIASVGVLSSIENPQIIGVVSPSEDKSFKIYMTQQSYDKWLFYYGQDPSHFPEIVDYSQKKDS